MFKRNFFTKWFLNQGRHFPWRNESTTPYQFLVTEMLLRQTRAPEVAKLWNNFFESYPSIEDLAKADRNLLTEQIAILGFGTMRSGALISAANWIVKKHDRKVPENVEELLAIPHVGTYAAHAVLCFAFGHKIEIVDGNVQRFYSRYFGIPVKPDIRRNPIIAELAARALPRERSKAKLHNFGLLDFTADICKPGKPRCEICPLAKTCKWGNIQIRKDLVQLGLD